MSEFKGVSAREEVLPEIKHFDGVGELAVGGSVSGGDYSRMLFICDILRNDPVVNSYLLANKLKLTDRVTKTKIFPREGMALPEGETYTEPEQGTETVQENS